jgi:hypothetical protein
MKVADLIQYTTVLEGGSVNRCFLCFKTPVIIANTGYRRKGLSRKLGCGKIAALALFLHIPTSRGDRPASPPDFPASRFSRNFSDLETPIYRAPLYYCTGAYASTLLIAYFALKGAQTKKSATRVTNNPQKKHEAKGDAPGLNSSDVPLDSGSEGSN